MELLKREKYKLQEDKIAEFIFRSIDIVYKEASNMAVSIFDWLADNNIMTVEDKLLPAIVIAGLSTEENWKKETDSVYDHIRENYSLNDLIQQITEVGYSKELEDSYIDTLKTMEKYYLPRQDYKSNIVYNSVLPNMDKRIHCRVKKIEDKQSTYNILYSYLYYDTFQEKGYNGKFYTELLEITYEKKYWILPEDTTSTEFMEVLIFLFNNLDRDNLRSKRVMLIDKKYESMISKYMVNDSMQIGDGKNHLYELVFKNK